jgi:hypothetical protein
MQNASDMEGSKPSYDLDKDIPDLLLFNVSLALLIVANFLEDVSVISILHHKTQTRSGLVNKGITVCNYIWMVD